MAIPKIKEATLPTPTTVILYFDSPLDSNISVPLSSFTVNYGQFGVETLVYSSDTMISLGLDSALSPWDEVFVSYEPPLDLSQCLRSPIPPGSGDVIKKRNAVRAFYRIPIRNSLAPDEGADGSHVKSNIEDASATTVNVAKMRMAIEDANALIDSYIEQSGKAGKVLITSNRRRTALIIARYYLDTVRKRDDIKSDYVEALKQLDAERGMTAIRAGHGDSAIDTKKGIMRSWRIPQRYNGVSGKGFSGWNSDTGGDQALDFRVGFGAVGQNNSESNWLTLRNFQDLGGTLQMAQPSDAGGLEFDGTTSYGG